MGYVQEKYTKTYFTGLNPDGTPANYGLEGNYNGTETTLRDFDIQILERVNFKNANVLEIGFGRGESIKYVMGRDAASYVGVDFAFPAFEMAQEYLEKNNLDKPKIYCCDALEFIQDSGGKITESIDIVLMLDVIEHIPRHELSSILEHLKKHLSEKAILVINTPVYKFDNDVITDGIDERNFVDALDQADFIEETKGMHCNKYTVSSLQDFMKTYDYLNITENHFYIYKKDNSFLQEFGSERVFAYSQLWQKAFKDEYPIEKEYVPDILEFAYKVKNPIELLSCELSMLKGVEFYGTPDALVYFQEDGSLSYFDQYIKEGQIIFDVGCYVGLSSLFFSRSVKKTGKVVCFEPNKYNLLRIKKNFSANPEYLDNVYLYDFGLSDNNESADMLLSDNIESGHASASQLVKGGGIAIPKAELEEMGFFKEKVKLKTLDSFVEESGLIPNIIKVDIEGAEMSFLKGGMETLAKHKPVLFIELHNVFSTCFVLQTLRQLNYNFHVLSEEWGNRAQIVAVFNDSTPVALSDSTISDVLFQSFSSYKAKLYQENLEEYSKLQLSLKKEIEDQLKELQLQHTSLQTRHVALQDQHVALQDQHVALQDQHVALQDQYASSQEYLQYLNSKLVIRAGRKVKSFIA